jgi:putative phosphoesterase
LRILVFSDSHGSTKCIRDALFLHKEASAVIHLGDGERDLRSFDDLLEGKQVVQVCGNCDFASLLPANELVTLASTRIFCTHGHTELVKHGTQTLYSKARALGARIALYGHTHQSVTAYDDGLYIMNPGCARNGEYGVIDITPGGIMLIKMKV